jgi:hypothetical protein
MTSNAVQSDDSFEAVMALTSGYVIKHKQVNVALFCRRAVGRFGQISSPVGNFFLLLPPRIGDFSKT